MGELYGIEVFVCWYDFLYGYVFFLWFIFFVEEIGEIENIGCWVIVEVCCQLVEWCSQNIYILVFFVNLLVLYFCSNQLFNQVFDVM